MIDLPFDEIQRAEVSILLGPDLSEAHWAFKHCIGERRQPFAVKTMFGWMLCGPLTILHNKASVSCTFINDPSIAEQIITLYDHEFTKILK